MRGKGVEQRQQRLILGLVNALVVELIDHAHERRNRGVRLEVVRVLADLLNRAMHKHLMLLRVAVTLLHLFCQSPDTLKEAAAALDRLRTPRRGLFKVADEHFIQAHGVRAIGIDDLIRIDDIAAALGHFLAVLAQDHAVARAAGIRLLGRHHTDVIQELMPETAVQQVQRGVLHAAIVPVDRRPVFQRLLGGQRLVVVRIHIAQEIPRRTSPLRHGVGLALGRTTTARAGGVDPIGHLGKR